MRLGRRDFDRAGFFLAQAEVIAANLDVQWIAHRGTANGLNGRGWSDAHLHQAALDRGRAAEFDDLSGISDGQFVECHGIPGLQLVA